jgi:hypothetical protein
VLTKLDVLGMRSLAPTLPLADGGAPGTDPLQILNIDGLNPVKAEITTQPFGSYDGEAYMGAFVGKRNVVLTIGLNPNWATQSIEALRQLCYNYFMPKLTTKLRFFSTHLPICEINGYVESLESNMWSKVPQMLVSIICPEPDFIASDPVVLNGTTNNGSPFIDFQNVGSVPSGLTLVITQAVGNPGENTIQLSLQNEYAPRTFISRGNITSTVRFELSTIPGQKYARSVVTTTGVVTNYLNSIAADAVWPLLYPGDNKLAVITPVVGQKWTLTYYPRFGGL